MPASTMRPLLMNFWNQHLTTKVASSFLLLSLLSVGAVGGVAFFKAREALKQAAFNRLSVSATLKEEEIARWFEDQQRDFLLVNQLPDIQRYFSLLFSAKNSDQDYLATDKVLSAYLLKMVQTKPSFQEIFILNRSNRIVICTNKQREGDYEVLANVTYFEKVESGSTFAPIFYVSPTTGKPAVTLATPLRDAAGVRQGLLLTHLNLDRIDRIVRERTGLGESGETYLVGSLVTQNTFISKDHDQTPAFPAGISSYGIDTAMQGVSSAGLYPNYAGVPVIGVYRWLNDQDLALLVEMQQEEAFAPARQLAGTIMLVGMGSAAVLLLGVNWLTRQLKISREQLENYSHRLEQKAQEAEAANRAKSEFLANMSHELRTPLNTILGFTQLMTRDRTLNPAQLEHLEIVSRSGEQLLTLINDVLSMAKIEAGRTTLNENCFDLYSLLDSLEEMLQLKAEAKGLQLIFSRSPEVPQYVQTDESKLRQVLLNLLGNAIKFTSAGGVTLRVSKPAARHFLRFEVADTGSGIAPAELEGLFKPFVQTETGRKSHQGSGLGLTISQQFVQLMGGGIAVSSTLGQGTVFTFEIQVSPVAETNIPTQPQYQRAIALAPHQPQYRILVVEDRWENRHFLVKLLVSLGFEVQEAENGQAAVHSWQTWEPHLILMDMRMPVMDGYEATRQIKAHLKGQATVIIALTASAFDEERSVVLSAGCDDFVRKPFQEETLLAKIADYLGVDYVYEPIAPRTNVSREHHVDCEPSSLKPALAQMSSEWLAQLHQAALRTDEQLIFSLLEQISASNPALAESLADLVHNFRIDRVIDLTQSDAE